MHLCIKIRYPQLWARLKVQGYSETCEGCLVMLIEGTLLRYWFKDRSGEGSAGRHRGGGRLALEECSPRLIGENDIKMTSIF